MGEAARLQALHGYEVLDAPADDELSAVVRAAAVVAGAPTATLNLIDENRQCQLTTVGFDGGDSARDDSMCAVVFASGRSTHVPDARLDARFAANPWVTSRAYPPAWQLCILLVPRAPWSGATSVIVVLPRRARAGWSCRA
ncbi:MULTISPECIES: hypothetical protein [unclassified Micromonospora]|uniref:hypothetical protein n=1 Tax=unclassified Micromonospora TaxID=2617518 RepID=UPI002FF11D63